MVITHSSNKKTSPTCLWAHNFGTDHVEMQGMFMYDNCDLSEVFKIHKLQNLCPCKIVQTQLAYPSRTSVFPCFLAGHNK